MTWKQARAWGSGKPAVCSPGPVRRSNPSVEERGSWEAFLGPLIEKGVNLAGGAGEARVMGEGEEGGGVKMKGPNSSIS